MKNEKSTGAVIAARETADRLRKLKESVRAIGKRSLADTFTAGAALEEAAKLLRGSYSSWVKTECGLEPRTALGFRKTFLVLGHRKADLIDNDVSASVAVMIASAKPEARERALAAIGSGRRLSVKDAKMVLNVSRRPPADEHSLALASFRRFLRARTDAAFAEASRIVDLATSGDDLDDGMLVEIAVRARALEPLLSSLNHRIAGEPVTESDDLMVALVTFAETQDPTDRASAANRLAELIRPACNPPTDPTTAPDKTDVSPPSRAPAVRSLSSSFRHGLNAFEVCAGAGGAAAGLMQAGFRHVGLLERNPDACKTLRAAFGPEHVIEADLVGYEPADVEDLDLLAGGVPCQPFSQAGAGKGAADRRDLFPEAVRLVKRLRPRAVMLENVTGLFAPDHDTYRFAIQAELKRLGYESEWRKVNASHFGVPQKRVRTILVAFREREAMSRFIWPTAWVRHHTTEPYPVIAALVDQLQSRGWKMPVEMYDRMDRAANTILGGSDLKQSADLGQRKGSMPWVEMGVIRTRIADSPPEPDHVGDIALTNKMLATLQGFPGGWPFQGRKDRVFKQIANAFPAPVAMHLGCAIATALTGEFVDPTRHYLHQGRKAVRLPRDLRSRAAAPITPTPLRKHPYQPVRIPLSWLREAASET